MDATNLDQLHKKAELYLQDIANGMLKINNESFRNKRLDQIKFIAQVFNLHAQLLASNKVWLQDTNRDNNFLWFKWEKTYQQLVRTISENRELRSQNNKAA